jgi:hypothetical protein
MICPSLPQDDYERFSRDACDAIRVERCEHVWAEVINPRGGSLARTINSLKGAGLRTEAELLQSACGKRDDDSWEKYARATYLAHAKNIPTPKLRFLQYVNEKSSEWWGRHRDKGAVLLGKAVPGQSVASTCGTPSVPVETDQVSLTDTEVEYLAEREKIVALGLRASIATAKAIFEIHSFNEGRLWRTAHPTFAAYCRARWDIGKSHSYRLVETGRFLAGLEGTDKKLSPNGDRLPKNEGQVRPLLALPDELRVECWKEILTDSLPADLTAREVNAKVRQFAENRELPGFDKSAPGVPGEAAGARQIAKLRKITSAHANHAKIVALLNEVEALMA